MGLFGNDAMTEFNDTHHRSITHDLLGAAAAYKATEMYMSHCEDNGQPDSHAKAKEIVAALVGAALTDLASTKGLDAWDEHKRKNAQELAEKQVFESVGRDEY